MTISQYSLTTRVVALCKFSGVNPRLCEFLFNYFNQIEDLLSAGTATLMKIDGMTRETADNIARTARHLEAAENYIAELKKRDIHIITRFDSEYSPLLFELNNPPSVLYVRGHLPDINRKTVALVGASEPTNEGIEMTTRLARIFTDKKVQVISSLSGGIDYAAHLGCKTSGGISFAVIDAGFDSLTVDDSMPVAIDIVQKGGLISEYPPEEKPAQDNYLETNRILVGLSQAVVVTELYHDSLYTLDLLKFCSMIGKLAFLPIDPELGAFADETSLNLAVEYGVIPMVGYDKVDDIIKALV
ncbi:MAG: DNA-processing protein DprA [candidate division Zixibacteria bacterium]|nr:DNA-processing protein DprA [candidate division Zixibacteria bacterium]MDD5427259.1 DNA-processing protein DprA [candidate division Zixibacteria bacterium]